MARYKTQSKGREREQCWPRCHTSDDKAWIKHTQKHLAGLVQILLFISNTCVIIMFSLVVEFVNTADSRHTNRLINELTHTQRKRPNTFLSLKHTVIAQVYWAHH